MNPMDAILKFLLLSSTIYLQTVFSCEIYSFSTSDGPLALDGHVIKTITKNIVNLCWAECVWLPWCFSLNARQISGGMFECELNNSSKKAKPNNMTNRQGWNYYEMQNVDESNRKLYEFKRKEDLGNGWYRYGNSSLKFFQEKKTWSDARSYCQSLGSDLASITSSHENDFLYGVFVENLNLSYTEHGDSSMVITEFNNIRHWKLNGDETFINLLGTPGDVSYELIDGEKSLYLNGQKGYVEMPAIQLNPDAFTISFWIKFSENTNDISHTVLHIYNDVEWKIVEFYVNTVEKLMYLMVKKTTLGSTSFDLNIWNHFAMDWLKSKQRVRLVHQGRFTKTFTASFSSLDITSKESIRIGTIDKADLVTRYAPRAYIKHLVFNDGSKTRHLGMQSIMYWYEQGAWIGMNYTENTQQQFAWSDGTPVQFTASMPPYWHTVLPDKSGRKCVAMAKERKWLDKHCMFKYPFICEKPAPP